MRTIDQIISDDVRGGCFGTSAKALSPGELATEKDLDIVTRSARCLPAHSVYYEHMLVDHIDVEKIEQFCGDPKGDEEGYVKVTVGVYLLSRKELKEFARTVMSELLSGLDSSIEDMKL